jgi:hypothetical protein
VQSKTAGNEQVLGFYASQKILEKKKTPIVKAYGKALSDDEIKSIMGRAVPQEWTVNLLVLSKEPWKFRDLNYQLATYLQQ